MSDNAGISDNSPDYESEGEGENVDADFSAIATRLRRLLVGVSRPALLAEAGISDRTLTRILAGAKARRGTLASIADAFKVLPEWFIHGTGPMSAHVPAQAPIEPEVPVFLRKTSISTVINLARLGAAIRIAQRRHPSPDTAEDWVAMARDVVDLYDELAYEAAHAADEKAP